MHFEDEQHELNVFEDIFYREIESGWNADHIYCDNCFDNFVAEWPLAYSARDAELQRAGIDHEVFYSGSRLNQLFTKKDYTRLIVKMSCPNCGAPLGGNFWPYHLPFNIPKTFVQDVREVGRLAKLAPFLLLSHPLSRRLFDLVRRVSITAPTQVVNDRLYRARSINASVSEDLACFDFPPAAVVSEGRYNHAGRPVLYLASSLKTCIAELRNAEALVASFNLTRPLKIFDLLDIDSFEGEDYDIMGALSFSALISAPHNKEGWNRPAYVFTRFLSDCATFFNFDAIKYPSTRLSDQDGSYNLVILKEDITLRATAREVTYQTHKLK
ncbi:RES family NAD+ phosphorylase [Burkholderia gladioli]|uniref:RES family NAD+ phosphorylase n=1 Tax=Burkholderia gladioli TaxID=28095 RepID=UPI00163FF42E|nr:RES family NAD+ phosphorylase [Burkholderia gladioli]MCH7269560.1 RES family NAD+ phosphorylase [Burkholderia gladioli]